MASFTHNNRTCIVCREGYRYCSSCKEFERLPRWYAMFDNENCKKLFDITSDLTDGVITDAEAKKLFAECDLSYKYKLHKNIVEAIDKVNGVTSTKEVVEKDEVEEQPIKKRFLK